MKSEQTADLGHIRLALQIGLIVLGLDIVGAALLAWEPSAHWRALGGLLLGFSLALLVGPRLKIWKV